MWRALISLARLSFLCILSVEVTVSGIIFSILFSAFLLLASRKPTDFYMLVLYIAILMKILLMILLESLAFLK